MLKGVKKTFTSKEIDFSGLIYDFLGSLKNQQKSGIKDKKVMSGGDIEEIEMG